MVGWLEVGLDPAPVVIVAGMNEGCAPRSIGAGSLLPNRLREALGLSSDASRLARDGYVLSALVESGREVRLIASRADGRGDPLRPSRLLLRTSGETLRRRVRRWVKKEEGTRRRPVLLDAPVQEQVRVQGRGAGFGERVIESGAGVGVGTGVERISVTAFKTYLNSPYVFYLRHVLRVSEVESGQRELSAARVGDVVHAALRGFARGEARDETDGRRVEEAILAELARVLREQVGERARRTVMLQMELLKLRIRHFAHAQARRRAQGWRIAHQEWEPPEQGVAFEVDGAPVMLVGRIDRVDVHEGTGAVAVLDYKTGESVEGAEKSHKRGGKWKDLQLPLYRHLARSLAPGGEIDGLKLEYAILPSEEGAAFDEAKWGPQELASADEEARRVVREIRAGRFGEVGRPWVRPGVRPGAIAALCGLAYLGGGVGEEEEA
jgi:hypothetical protein